MKNKNFLILGVILSVISLSLLAIGAVTNITLLIIGCGGSFIGIYTLMYWNTVSYQWICTDCGRHFDITLKQNIFGVNIGVNSKMLYCSNCQKKTICQGIKK